MHTWCILKGCIDRFALLLPLPQRCKVDFTLRAAERLLRWRLRVLFLCDVIDNSFQAQQIDELRIAWIRDEVHFWRWWFWWWNLQQRFL